MVDGGSDVDNGQAIYGAREGLVKTMLTDWDFVNVRDFKYLNDLWKEKELPDSTKNAYRSNRNIRSIIN